MKILIRAAMLLVITAVVSFVFAQPRERGLRVGVSQEDLQKKNEVNLHAVLIGISRYQYGDQVMNGRVPIPNLKNAADDALGIYKFLRSPEGGGFPEANIKLLLDEQATKAEVEKALNGLLQIKPSDYYVVYIAGHGFVMERTQMPYFAMYDIDPKNPEQAGLRMEFFQQIVSKIPAQKGLVISDTCHSEGVLLEPGRRALSVTREATSALLEKMKELPRGIAYMSAASVTEKSQERDELGHGVFTHFLLEAMRGNADADADGVVTFDETRRYISVEVPKYTNGEQNPISRISSIAAGLIPLSAVSYPEVKGLPKCDSDHPCGTLHITNPELEDVTLAIEGTPVGSISLGNQRTFRLPAGNRKLTLIKGSAKQTQLAEIIEDRSTSYEINAAFTAHDGIEFLDPSAQQKIINFEDEQPPKKEAEQILQQGVEQFNKQKFREAIDLINKALSVNGVGYSQALAYRGQAQKALGLINEAINSFQMAVNLHPTDYQTKTLLAEAQFQAGWELEKVVKDLRTITKGYSSYAPAWTVLGDVLFVRGDRIGAERALRTAIKQNPKFAPAHMILANVLMYKAPQSKILDGGELKTIDWALEAVSHAQKALDLFEEFANKKRSLASGTAYKKTTQFFSFSYLLFGGGRYADEPALAEANYILGKAYTRLVGYDNGSLSDAKRDEYLAAAAPRIQEALRLARKNNDKLRLVVTLATSADHAFLKGDSARAKKEALDAMKMIEGMPNAELTEIKFDLCLNLYLAYNTDQEYGKAYEYLSNGLKLMGARLGPDDVTRYQDLLRECENNMKANRKRK